MLVIGRKAGEEIIIRIGGGGAIRITVEQLFDKRVRLGFRAPDHIQINRLELDKLKFPEDYGGQK